MLTLYIYICVCVCVYVCVCVCVCVCPDDILQYTTLSLKMIENTETRRKGHIISLTLRRLMSYIYGAPILDVSRSHTTTQHIR